MPAASSARQIARQWPYATLLGLLLFLTAGRALLPMGVGQEEAIRQGSVILTLLACAWALSRERHGLLLALGLSVAPILSQFLSPQWDRWQLWLSGSFYLVTAMMTLKNVFTVEELNADKIFGAACAYMLLGLVWAHAYILIELHHPSSFRLPEGSLGPSVGQAFDDLQYFSMVTMTTVGYGDITPVTRAARSLATLEAVFGQFYIAVLVGRLLAIYMEVHRPGAPPSDPPVN